MQWHEDRENCNPICNQNGTSNRTRTHPEGKPVRNHVKHKFIIAKPIAIFKGLHCENNNVNALNFHLTIHYPEARLIALFTSHVFAFSNLKRL